MKIFIWATVLTASPLMASEVITEQDRFIDTKTGKYVSVCEQKDGEYIVKESCGKYWKPHTRKRDQIIKEVKTFGELEHYSMVMFAVKNTDGDPKMVLGRVNRMYENGRIDVMEYYTKRFGINPGTMHWSTNYKGVVKLKKDHPILKHSELCLKEDTTIIYNYDDDRKYPLKKGEKVALKAVFENNTAAISINSFTDKFRGYGFENQLPLEISKLEECADSKKEVVDDSARNNTKPKEAFEGTNQPAVDQNTLAK